MKGNNCPYLRELLEVWVNVAQISSQYVSLNISMLVGPQKPIHLPLLPTHLPLFSFVSPWHLLSR